MVQRYALRPGKYDQWQLWRGPGDEPGRAAPLHAPADPDGADAFESLDWRMSDMSDGWEWRTIQWGLQRRRFKSTVSYWEFEDVDVHEINQRFVSLDCGLVLAMNIDW